MVLRDTLPLHRNIPYWYSAHTDKGYFLGLDMADKRMFSKKIIDSDAFLDMPLSSQCLYFHLSMRADDDGFVNNPRRVQRAIGATDDDLKVLLMKRFIIGFDSGVVVIKHWRINNYIQKDRYTPTLYQEEYESLIKNENKAYSLENYGDCIPCIQNVYKMDTQIRLDKIREEENRLDKSSFSSSTANGQPTVNQNPEKEMDTILNAWNALPCTVHIKSIIPMTKRYDEVRVCLSLFGLDTILDAIDHISKSEYLSSRGSVVFDRFINRNVIQGLVEGAYDKDFNKELTFDEKLKKKQEELLAWANEEDEREMRDAEQESDNYDLS